MTGTVPVGSGLDVRSLDGGRAVTALHHGPYEMFGEAWERVLKYVQKNGLVPSSPAQEFYLNDPQTKLTSELLTELQLLVGGEAALHFGPKSATVHDRTSGPDRITRCRGLGHTHLVVRARSNLANLLYDLYFSGRGLEWHFGRVNQSGSPAAAAWYREGRRGVTRLDASPSSPTSARRA